VVLLANSFMRRNSSLEIRIVDSEKYNAEKQKEMERETFALIRLKGMKHFSLCVLQLKLLMWGILFTSCQKPLLN